MSYRRQINAHDTWRALLRENAGLLEELPREALANEKVFRDYVTRGAHQGVELVPSVFQLSSRALGDLWTFINHKAQFDMDAQQTIEAMHSDHWRNEVAPRVLFEMMRYKPSDAAHKLAMPVLVCLAEQDREVPAELVRQIAERAPRGELESYPVAHFDFYQPEVRAQVVQDQIDFLRKHLGSRGYE